MLVHRIAYTAQGNQTRIYVKDGVAKPSKNGFTIVAKDWTIHTKALRHDKDGTYVLLSDIARKKGIDVNGVWICMEVEDGRRCNKRCYGLYGRYDTAEEHTYKTGHKNFRPAEWWDW